MKKLLFLLFLLIIPILFLIRCCYEDSIKIECLKNYSFPENITINNIEDCFNWTNEHIKFIIDKISYVQTPEETYSLRAGDCEDMCLMTMYFLNKFGIDSELIFVKVRNKGNHTIIKINNNYFESVQYRPINDTLENGYYKEFLSIPYCEAIYQAVHYHQLYE